MEQGMRALVMAAGGTGGHVYPAVAVARAWLARHPGDRIVFLGTERGLERTAVPREGFELRPLPARGVVGKNPLAALRGLWSAAMSFKKSRTLLGEIRPVAVLGAGGYASFAPTLAACTLGIPTLVLEVNRTLGLANRILKKFADATTVSFEETLQDAGPRAHWTGTPVRALGEPAREHEKFGLLIVGGSQGAESLNRMMQHAAPLLAPHASRLFVIHMRGRGKGEELESAYESAGLEARVVEYIKDMAWAYAQADLVVARAGATTLAELAFLGKPAVLIPFPHAAGHHQRDNALAFERAGAAHMLDPDAGGQSLEEAGASLAEAIVSMLENPERLRLMQSRSRSLGQPGAAERVVEILEKLAGAKGRV
ncbi:MAG: undecaprenyldiphospho-muramoylpentapeptide beta-N-acetylglucosaminyltransferase [Acidobacteriota bacterium]|nr:MAG: undecaprenyldiphospho-muramoylpentapeptide beta-N-acetylglucosaminyltransferase [Acidobacteriota bacterium]